MNRLSLHPARQMVTGARRPLWERDDRDLRLSSERAKVVYTVVAIGVVVLVAVVAMAVVLL